MNHRVTSTVVGSAMMVLCVIKPCAAAAEPLIITPVGAYASSTVFNMVEYSPPTLIDGSGLTGYGREATHTTVNIANVTWNSDINAPAAGQWVEFDLGTSYDVTNALIWQLATVDFTSSGVQDYTISVAGRDHLFSLYPSGTLTLARATDPSLAEPVQVVPLVAKNIRYIRLNILSNWGGSSGVSLAEVRFEGFLSEATPPDVILAPVGATASTTWAGEPGYLAAQYLIDGSGLTGSGAAATHSNAGAPGLFWHSETGVDVAYQWIEFDLGASYDVRNTLIWQLDQAGGNDRGVRRFTIRVAGDDHIFATVSTDNLLIRATGSPEIPVQILPLRASNIRYIRFNIQSNWGAGGIVGLSEVRFMVAPPSTAILQPVGANASSFYAVQYWPQLLIDGSGLIGYGREATHTTENIPNVTWNSDIFAPAAGQWVEFDLGASYDVMNALIWQLATVGFTSSGVQDYTISVAGTDHLFALYPAGTLTLARATDPSPAEPVQVVPLVAQNIRYIKLNILSNWGGTSGVSLGEVRFEGVLSKATSPDVILAPIGATASTSYTGENGYLPQCLIDGSGLSGIGRLATHTYLNALNLFWHSAVGIDVSQQWVEFDLGATYDVANVLIWQLAQKDLTARGVQRFMIKVASPDHLFSTVSVDNLLNQATGTPNEPVQVLPLVANNVRYIRFEIQSNWGSAGIVGLSEVRFEVQGEVAPDETKASVRIPVAIEASSSNTGNSPSYLIDGSGLTGTDLAATHADGLGQNSMWLSDGGAITNQWLEFDFGMEMKLVAAALWQYNQTATNSGQPFDYTGRGVRGMTIFTAGNDKIYTEYGGVRLAGARGLAAEPVQLVPLTADRVRYVKFAINSNWGYDSYVGLSEVRFLFKKTGMIICIH